MKLLKDIQSATKDLRNRSGIREFATRVNNGKGQLVWVTFNGDKSNVVPASEWVPVEKLAELIRTSALQTQLPVEVTNPQMAGVRKRMRLANVRDVQINNLIKK